MKQNFLRTGLATIAVGIALCMYAGPIDVNRAAKAKGSVEKPKSTFSYYPSSVVPVGLKASQKKSDVVKQSIILDEDFSNVPDGTTQQTGQIGERYVDLIAHRDQEPGRYIANEYTPSSGTWEGNWVYAGKNGTIVLQADDPVEEAELCTPLGDYSGDITVTAKVRAATVFWASDNETGYTTSDGSGFSVSAKYGGYDEASSSVVDFTYKLGTGPLYENDGWVEVTFTFRNESANSDGFLIFSTAGSIEIDWIKITDSLTFLACPVVESLTDFKEDGFTINWQPVRRAFNYYIDLWKASYTSEIGVDFDADFDDNTLPEGAVAEGSEIVSGEGVDGTSALKLAHGEAGTFTTVDLGTKLEKYSVSMKFKITTETSNATFMIEGKTDAGWEAFAMLQYDGYYTKSDVYYTCDIEDYGLEDMYTSIRIYAMNIEDGNEAYIDDAKAFAARPYTLERVTGPNGSYYQPMNDDYAYNYYDKTEHKDTSCTLTVTGLDPNTEYYYRVRAHNGTDFTIGEKYHAFGVASPTLEAATEVGNGSYTAHWTDVAKAQSYIVSNYSITTLTENESAYPVLEETFSNATGSEDVMSLTNLGNSTAISLDEYTDEKGWTGVYNAIGKNMVGVQMYSGGYLLPPPIMVNPERGTYQVYISAKGVAGDYLYLSLDESGVSGYIPFDSDGTLSGWVPIDEVCESEKFRFSSYNAYPFCLTGFGVYQEAFIGDTYKKLLGSEEVAAGIQSCTFTGLDPIGTYCFDVVSKYELDGKTAYSSSSETMTVNMNSTTSETTGIEGSVEPDGNRVISRYSLEGMSVDESYKGIVIEKMSNGTCRKKIIK